MFVLLWTYEEVLYLFSEFVYKNATSAVAVIPLPLFYAFKLQLSLRRNTIVCFYIKDVMMQMKINSSISWYRTGANNQSLIDQCLIINQAIKSAN